MIKLRTYTPDYLKQINPQIAYKVKVTSYNKVTSKLVVGNQVVVPTGKGKVNPKEKAMPWGNSLYLQTSSKIVAGDVLYLVCRFPSKVKSKDLSKTKGGKSQELPYVDGINLIALSANAETDSLTPQAFIAKSGNTFTIVPIPLPPSEFPIEEVFRLGYTDLSACVEGIGVSQEISVDEVPILRNRGTIKKGHGHTLRKVSIPLNFSDEKEAMKLCHLIRQIRHMPILPVENAELEGKGIDALAITGVNFSTVEGFPGNISAQIDAVEFDWRQYFPDDDSANFTDLWCWPLFKIWVESNNGRSPYPEWQYDVPVNGHVSFKSPRIEIVEKLEDFKATAIKNGQTLKDSSVGKKAMETSDLTSSYSIGPISGKGIAYVYSGTETVKSLNLVEDKRDDVSYFEAEVGGRKKLFASFTPKSVETLKLAVSKAEDLGNNVFIYSGKPNLAARNNTLELLPDLDSPEQYVFNASNEYQQTAGEAENYFKSLFEISKIQKLSRIKDRLDEAKTAQRSAEVNPAQYSIVAEVGSPFFKELSKKAGNLVPVGTSNGNLYALPDTEDYWITWNFDWVVESISAGFMNIFAAQQPSSTESPALQFVGSSNIQLRLAATGFGSRTPAEVQKMLDYVNAIALKFKGLGLKDSYGGFLHIENELTRLIGMEWALPISLQTTTVPEFPDDRGILLTLEEFDIAQSNKEGLNEFYPTRTGMMPSSLKDLDRIDDGIAERAIALRDFDRNLKDIELYPDLNLPTKRELNSYIIDLKNALNNKNASFITNQTKESVEGPFWDTSSEQLKRLVNAISGSKDEEGFAEPDFFCVSRFKLTPEVNAALEANHGSLNQKLTSVDGAEAYSNPGTYLDTKEALLGSVRINNIAALSKQEAIYNAYEKLVPTRQIADSVYTTDTSIGVGGAGVGGYTSGGVDFGNFTPALTFKVNAKITSYGYPSDEYKDSGTSRGVGFKENKLRVGSIAFSPDIQRQFQAAKGQELGPLQIKLVDGTIINGFWDDKTSASLGGRVDVYTKHLGTPHPKDGMKVDSITVMVPMSAEQLKEKAWKASPQAKQAQEYQPNALDEVANFFSVVNPKNIALVPELLKIAFFTKGDKDTNIDNLPMSDAARAALKHFNPDTGNLMGAKETKTVELKSQFDKLYEYETKGVKDASNQYLMALEDNNNYEMANRLALAFPAYCVLLIDGGRWLRAWRLFDRMFGMFGVSSIQVYKTREDPAHVAQVVFSNIYNKLTNQIADEERANRAGITRWTMPWVGEMLYQAVLPTPSEEMFNIRAQVLNSLMLKAGTRMHLRLGYGSDASKFPVAFNGTVMELPIEEGAIRVIAIGDGHELKKDICPSMMTAGEAGGTAYRVTALFGGGKDPRNTVLELFTATAENILGDIANRVSKGVYVHNNVNGIEHFGRAVYSQVAGGSPSPGEIGVNIYGLREDPVNKSTAASNMLGWLWTDSDINIGINVPNANTWDVIETVRKLSPDFLAYVHEFGLRSTLFMGRPYWNLYYDYDPDKVDRLIKEKGKIVFDDPNEPGRKVLVQDGYIPPDDAHVLMKSKCFQQLRVISSDYNLFESKIAATSEEVYTACQLTEESAGFKSILNGARTFSSFMYFDNEVYTSDIRVKTGNSNVLVLGQNQVGNFLHGEFSAFTFSSRANENVTLSEIKDGLKKMYKGHFLVRGDASYKPFDLVFVADDSKNLSGLCEVREVVHEFSLDTGFLTSISPDICAVALDPYQISWNIWANQIGASIATRRKASHIAASVFTKVKNGAFLGKSIDDIATKLKGLTKNPETQKAIDAAVAELRAGEFLKTEKSGGQILRAITEKVKESKTLPAKGLEAFNTLIAKAQHSYNLEKVSNVAAKAKELAGGIKSSETFVNLTSKGKVFAEAVTGEKFIKGATNIGKAVRASKMIASFGVYILIDTAAEIFNRKLAARKTCVLMPLRVGGHELTAGITGHRGGVLGDPETALESTIKMWTKFDTKNFESESLGKTGYGVIGPQAVAGILWLFGVQDVDRPR